MELVFQENRRDYLRRIMDETKARIDRLYELNRFKVRFMDVFPYQAD